MAVNGIGEHSLTTHIIYHEEDNNGISIPRIVDLRTGDHSPPQKAIRVCSSSKGRIGHYFLYNPLVSNLLKALPFHIQPYSHQDPSYAVVTLDGSTFDAVVLQRYHFDAAVLQREQIYEEELYYADVFSSDTDSHTVMEFAKNYRVLPNSGVSCGRNVYFLTNANSVLKIDVANRKTSDIFMPINDISAGDITAAQLGRKRDMLGLAVANESKLWIKVYLHAQTGDMYNWTHCCSVNVELDPGCDDVSVIQDGRGGAVGRIRCKEMPRPVRFESFRLQVPLWADGRIVIRGGARNLAW